MIIYFVRHGESEGNVSGLEHNDGGLKLTTLGVSQAEFVAKRFDTIPLDVIISSHYHRARQTSEIISAHLKKEIIVSELFGERVLPSEMIGKKIDDDEVLSIHKLLRENFHKENARHSDEENFADMKKRASEALQFLRSQPFENILVVSHASFIKTLLSYMVFGHRLNSREFFSIQRSFRIKNTSITKVETRERTASHDFEWYIDVWNDHAHLGEIKN
jgi:uncharacterized phosphatase